MKTTSKTFAALLGLATAVALAVPASAKDGTGAERGHEAEKVSTQGVAVSSSGSMSLISGSPSGFPERQGR